MRIEETVPVIGPCLKSAVSLYDTASDVTILHTVDLVISNPLPSSTSFNHLIVSGTLRIQIIIILLVAIET